MTLRAVAVALMLLLAAGCGGDQAPPDLIPPPIPPATAGAPPAADARNVLLITVDTTRADRLGCYGFSGAETPAMDRLAAGGVRFEDFYCHVPITLPSHTSILTGMRPCEHGVRDNGLYEAGEDLRTLAEILDERGYATAAVIGAYVLDAQYGLDQGFDLYDDDFVESRQQSGRFFTERSAEEVARHGIAWIDESAKEPFFLWLHLFDPHMGYVPPEPFLSRFRGDLYSGEIAYADHWIGKVLDRLDQPGSGGAPLAERTIAILTSDHGESLGEHGEETHAFFIYQSTIRVPMIIRCPGFAPRQVGGVGRSIDIAPTVLELLGIGPEPQMTGRSLVSAMRGEPQPRLAYMESEMPLRKGCTPLRGISNGRWKYIEAPEPELYDLLEDPGELQNVHGDRPAIAAALRAELLRIGGPEFSAAEGSRKRETTRDERKMLEALGYAGGSAEDRGGARLRDPKEMIHAFTAVHKAMAAADAGHKVEALDILDEARRNHPAYIDLYTSIGAIALEVGRNEEAVRAYEKAIELEPDSTLALNGAAAGRARLGDNEAALRLVQRSIELDSENPETRNTSANIYSRIGDHGRAIEECLAGLALDPESVELHNTMGMIQLEKNDPAAAVAALSKAVELNDKFWLAFYNLGLAFGRLEQPHAALDALIRAKNLNPRDPRVTRALAKAYFRSAEADLAASPPDPAAARAKAEIAQKLGLPVPPAFWSAIEARARAQR